MGLIGAVKNKAAIAAIGTAVFYVRHDKEYGPVFAKVIRLFNHKAVYTGAVVAALPTVAAAIGTALVKNGFDPVLAAQYTAWGSGVVLVVAGMVHRIVKWADDQTPD